MKQFLRPTRLLAALTIVVACGQSPVDRALSAIDAEGLAAAIETLSSDEFEGP